MKNTPTVGTWLLVLLTTGIFQIAAARSMPVGQNFLPGGWGKWSPERGTGTNPFQGGISNITGFDPIWTSVFLEEIKPFPVFRFMDWCYVNNTSRSGKWADRAQPTDPTAWYPVAFEHMIELCNRSNADGWFCVIHTADDDYMKQMARLIHTTLNPPLKCYIEWSNETWNFAFTQGSSYGNIQGRSANTAERSAAMFKIFEDEFGADAETRLVKVLGSWVEPYYTDMILKDFSANPYGVTADAVATAPYVGAGVPGSTANFPLLYAALVAEMEKVRKNRESADKYGVDLIAYEGGHHIISGDNASMFTSPLMYDFYTAYYDSMSNYFDLFVNYAYAGWGWGVKDWIGQPIEEAHRYRAIVDWKAANNVTGTVKKPKPVSTTNHVSVQSGANVFDMRGRRVGRPAASVQLLLNAAGDGRLPTVQLYRPRRPQK